MGEYAFNFLAANESVNGQTFTQWYIDEYLYGPSGGGNANVSGFFFDDSCCPDAEDNYGMATHAWGQNSSQVAQGKAAFKWHMQQVYAALYERRAFSWQQTWTGVAHGQYGYHVPNSTDPRYPSTKPSCAQELRRFCDNETASLWNSTMLYSSQDKYCTLRPGQNYTHCPRTYQNTKAAITNFLLLRNEHSYFGWGWSGCSTPDLSRNYTHWLDTNAELLDADYGTPLGICKETKAGLFVREWTKATVSMDCNTFTPAIEMHKDERRAT